MMKNKKKLLMCILLFALILCIICLVHANKKCLVKFDTDGGTLVEEQKIKKGSLVSRPSNPTKEGYVFLGWFLDDKYYLFDEKVNKNITLTGKWTQTEYHIEISLVDDYSPDRYITVYLGEEKIKVKKLMYLDDVEIICYIDGTQISVANVDIMNESALKVVLENDETVIAYFASN